MKRGSISFVSSCPAAWHFDGANRPLPETTTAELVVGNF